MNPTEMTAVRQTLGLTTNNLADLIGVKRMTAYRWETGQSDGPGRQAACQYLTDLYARFENLIENLKDQPTVTIYKNDHELWQAQPQHNGIPAKTHTIAAGIAHMESGTNITK